ncbi:glycosyltransferase family 2 protein [Candidatus Saccharibacteria bacterium]|nr:glycosyltransferase family 2 protein [Candidatus Saccharibacteria bacterium]
MKNSGIKILLIIPAYNEEASIKKTIDTVANAKYDYVIINDGSTDKTRHIIEENHYNHITLLSNLGIGGAVQTGYKYADENNYDIAIQFDADGQHDINYVQSLINPIFNKEADLVVGSCFVDKTLKNQRSSKIRRFGIHLLSDIIRLFSGKRIHDPTSGFRAANRKVIKLFAKNYPTEYPEPISDYELLRSSHYKIKEVPVKMNKRIAGKSSIHSWKSVYAAINVFLSIVILSLGRKSHD